MRHVVLVVLSLCIGIGLGAAGSLWSADAVSADLLSAGAASWPANPGYKASQADGTVTLTVDKQVMWAAQQLTLAEPRDLSLHPQLTVQIKTSQPMVLDVYLLNGKAAANLPLRIRAVGDFQTYGWDFSALPKFDCHHITGILFCVNGAATSWSGVVQLRQLLLGDEAALLPQIEAVEDQEWYHDTGAHAALLTGIAHVRACSLSGAERLLRNVAFSPIAAGHCTMSYELVPGASGTALATLTAAGEDGYASATRSFTVLVEDNLPPTIDAHPPVTALVGSPLTIRFSGVSDGNFTADQPLTVTVGSSNPGVIAAADIEAANPNGGRYLDVRLTPRQAGDTTLTVTLDDKSGGKSTVTTSTSLHAVKTWNNPPTLDPIHDLRGFVAGGDQTITLTGISDGDQGRQKLSFVATSANAQVVPDPSVAYSGGTAVLHFNPTATPGKATITVLVTDDGGDADNNGNQSLSRTFVLTTGPRPLSAYTADFAGFAALEPKLKAEDGVKVSADTDGGTPAQPVLAISCKDKSTYGGLWLTLPDMDLTEAPYLSVDVKCEQKIAFNMYFFDGDWRRNDGAARTTTIGGPGSGWKTVTFDFSGKGQMADTKSQPIKSGYITTVLFNFHPNFNWPFSNWTGTLSFRNLRIGKAADVPKKNPLVAMDRVPAQVLRQGSGTLHLAITGLSVAGGQPITLTAGETGTTQVAPALGAIREGSAELTLTAAQPGRSTVTITASAPDADPATTTFTVDVVDAGAPGTVTIDPGKTFQTIRGFGTFFGPDVDIYTKELGASAMRIGDECDFDPRKDTSDLNVLNRGRLNYKAFDWDYFRRMKAAGVETFFFTAWSPPAWQKTNFSTNFQGGAGSGDTNTCLNRLDFACYDDYAKTMVEVVRMFQEEAGITLDAISLQNEPSFCEPYGSGILDPPHMVRLIDVVGPRFEREGIPTRFLEPEQVFTQGNMLDYIRVLNADPVAEKYCTIVATHGYDDRGVKAASPDFPGWRTMFDLAQKGGVPKELWMSETYPEFHNWSSAMDYSMTLFGALEFGDISLWTQWSIEGTLLNHNLPTDSFWVVRQYWKYIRPGARRLASASSEASVFATSYLNDEKHGGKLVCVITNRKAKPAILKLAPAGRTVAAWQVVSTDPVRHGAELGELKADEALLLAPNSVTTVVEK